MASCNLSATNWFYLDSSDIESISSSSPIWPWLHIDLAQWSHYILPKVTTFSQLLKVAHLSVLLITPIGLIGSLFSMLSVWRKATKEKERFYIWMLLISSLDFLFNLLYIPDSLYLGLLFPNLYKYSYIGTQSMIILGGVVYGVSLCSDLCTLVLTVERFFVICKPVQQARIQKPTFTTFNGLLILTLSLCRFVRYAFEHWVAEGGMDASGRMTYTRHMSEVNTVYFDGLIFFSDVLLPFVLLVLMSYFSSRIAWAVYQRSKSRVFDSAGQQQQKSIQEQSTAMIKLLFILDAMFACNQFGYSLYAVALLIAQYSGLAFESSYEEVIGYGNVVVFWNVSNLFNVAMECLSRGLNFFFYYALCSTLRQEFKLVSRRG